MACQSCPFLAVTCPVPELLVASVCLVVKGRYCGLCHGHVAGGLGELSTVLLGKPPLTAETHLASELLLDLELHFVP